MVLIYILEPLKIYLKKSQPLCTLWNWRTSVCKTPNSVPSCLLWANIPPAHRGIFLWTLQFYAALKTCCTTLLIFSSWYRLWQHKWFLYRLAQLGSKLMDTLRVIGQLQIAFFDSRAYLHCNCLFWLLLGHVSMFLLSVMRGGLLLGIEKWNSGVSWRGHWKFFCRQHFSSYSFRQHVQCVKKIDTSFFRSEGE